MGARCACLRGLKYRLCRDGRGLQPVDCLTQRVGTKDMPVVRCMQESRVPSSTSSRTLRPLSLGGPTIAHRHVLRGGESPLPTLAFAKRLHLLTSAAASRAATAVDRWLACGGLCRAALVIALFLWCSSAALLGEQGLCLVRRRFLTRSLRSTAGMALRPCEQRTTSRRASRPWGNLT